MKVSQISQRVVLVLTMVVGLAAIVGCDRSTDTPQKAANEAQEQKSFSVVVPVTIDAFTRFEDEFRRVAETEGITVSFFSAEGDPTKFDIVVQQALRNDPDVFVAVGTQLTNISLSGPAFRDRLPQMIASCISGPSKVESLTAIGLEPPRSAPVAIISDSPAVDIYAQSADLLAEMLSKPDATVGVLLTPGEINSENTAGQLIAAVEAKGMNALRGTLTGPADVSPVTESLLVRGADVLVIVHDKAATTEAAAVVKLGMESSGGPVPVFALDDGTVRTHGAAIAVSVSYGEIGALTAEKAIALLSGEDPAMMPIAQQEHAKVYASRSSLQALGIAIDSPYLENAIFFD